MSVRIIIFCFEGGSEEFRWAASAGYKDIQGAMLGSERKTFNGSITLSYTYKDLFFVIKLVLVVIKVKKVLMERLVCMLSNNLIMHLMIPMVIKTLF